MNQEELDALVGEDFEEFDEAETLDGKSEEIDEDIVDEFEDEIIDDTDEIIDETDDIAGDTDEMIDDMEGFEDVLESSASSDEKQEDEEIVPPPADNKNKVVAQLDEVTKESEEKATQILDIMDEISANTEKNLESLKEVLDFLNRHKVLCQKLHEKFPHIKTFEKELVEIDEIIDKIQKAIETNEATSEKIFTAMDIMQYQDIHRQKIERVINIMRALIKYMNKLFEGSVEDEKRVQSARHIHGDKTGDVLSDEDIEALLDQFGV